MKDIKSMTKKELEEELLAMGEKAFRAGQLYQWMHVKLARSFDEMTNLSKAFREKLKEEYTYTALQAVQVQESKLDGIRYMRYSERTGDTGLFPEFMRKRVIKLCRWTNA